MTKQEKQRYMEMPSVAYYSGFGGIEIKEIQYGIEDYVVFVANAWYPGRTVHRVKINYTWSRPSFRYHLLTIHFDECLRMEVQTGGEEKSGRRFSSIYNISKIKRF